LTKLTAKSLFIKNQQISLP